MNDTGPSRDLNPPKLSLGDVLLRMPQIPTDEWVTLPAAVQWLVMVRAPVLVMTLTSVAVGVLPAMSHVPLHPFRLAALFVGLVFAHATNNLINDYVDTHNGLDTANYFRRRYGAHALQDGLVTRRTFAWVTILTGAVALACAGWLVWMLGTGTFYLTLAGSFFVVCYTWPLKHFALGELAVLLVWGPLMTAGSFYVMSGTLTTGVAMLSLVYGIGPTLVILGKHIDKVDQDREKQVRTLPVVVGERGARYLSFVLLVAQWFLLVSAIFAGSIPFWAGTTLFSLPAAARLVRHMKDPRPDQRPERYSESVWPLWFSAYAFRYSRDFGVLLVAGLAFGGIIA